MQCIIKRHSCKIGETGEKQEPSLLWSMASSNSGLANDSCEVSSGHHPANTRFNVQAGS